MSETMIKADDLTLAKLKEILQAAFLQVEEGKEGEDLVIRDEGVNTICRVDGKRKMLTMFSLWPLRESAPLEKKLAFINYLNDKLILARFSMPRPTTLWCDYQVMFDGGITPFMIINTYRRFVSVCRDAVGNNDPENLVGKD